MRPSPLPGVEGRKSMLAYYCQIVMYDWGRWILSSTRHVAYLGRYAPGLGVNSAGRPVEAWPLSRLLAYAKMISDIIERENKPK